MTLSAIRGFDDALLRGLRDALPSGFQASIGRGDLFRGTWSGPEQLWCVNVGHEALAWGALSRNEWPGPYFDAGTHMFCIAYDEVCDRVDETGLVIALSSQHPWAYRGPIALVAHDIAREALKKLLPLLLARSSAPPQRV